MAICLHLKSAWISEFFQPTSSRRLYVYQGLTDKYTEIKFFRYFSPVQERRPWRFPLLSLHKNVTQQKNKNMNIKIEYFKVMDIFLLFILLFELDFLNITLYFNFEYKKICFHLNETYNQCRYFASSIAVFMWKISNTKP